MLIPKNFKHRKLHKGKIFKPRLKFNLYPTFGFFLIIALNFMRLDSKYLAIILRKFARLGKRSKSWLRVLPTKSLTAQNEKARMGKGVGAINRWCCYVYPGQVLFELSTLRKSLLHPSVQLCLATLPIKVKLCPFL